jgi:hypothetical protein
MKARSAGYSKRLAEQICERLAAGESLRAICRGKEMPSEAVVRLWVIQNRDGFAEAYARARDIGLDCKADEILEIAETLQIGEEETISADGRSVTRKDMVAHRRLRVDTLKWYLCKLAPKKYGDKVDLMHRGDSTAPIVISATDGKL